MTHVYNYDPEYFMNIWRDEARDWQNADPHDFELPDIDPPEDAHIDWLYDQIALADFAPGPESNGAVPAGYFPRRANWYARANWATWADAYGDIPF